MPREENEAYSPLPMRCGRDRRRGKSRKAKTKSRHRLSCASPRQDKTAQSKGDRKMDSINTECDGEVRLKGVIFLLIPPCQDITFANVYHSVVECAAHPEEHPVRVIWALHGDHVLCLICLAPLISILRTPFKLAQHIFRRLHTVSRRSCTTYLGPLVQSLKQDTFEPHPLTDSGNLEYSSSGDSIITY